MCGGVPEPTARVSGWGPGPVEIKTHAALQFELHNDGLNNDEPCSQENNDSRYSPMFLRWDHGDMNSYYNITGILLADIDNRINLLRSRNDFDDYGLQSEIDKNANAEPHTACRKGGWNKIN